MCESETVVVQNNVWYTGLHQKCVARADCEKKPALEEAIGPKNLGTLMQIDACASA